MALERGQMPFVGITDVTIEILVHIQFLRLQDRRQEQRQGDKYELEPFHHSTQAQTTLSFTSTKPEDMGQENLSPSRRYDISPCSRDEMMGA